ncbi:Putative transposase of IS4/5 family [Nitrosomonas sp. Nm58]|nr:Putative transposase of IS4/5 family [Nitrosomonas sp. Nm58]
MVWISDTRKDYARDCNGYASDMMIDAEWKKIAPHLPPCAETGHPRTTCFHSRCKCRFLPLQSGCQRDMLSKDFPP